MNLVLAVLATLALASPPVPSAGPPAAPPSQAPPGPLPGPAVAPAAGATRPLEPGQVVAGFDPPSVTWAAGHRGVDLLGRPGQQVRAALAGTVTFAGTVAGQGVVVVTHGPFRTTYEPVLAWVQAGDSVAAGQVLGVLAPAPSHCAPRACLHWGLVEGTGAAEQYGDPLSLLGRTSIRLLPLQGG